MSQLSGLGSQPLRARGASPALNLSASQILIAAVAAVRSGSRRNRSQSTSRRSVGDPSRVPYTSTPVRGRSPAPPSFNDSSASLFSRSQGSRAANEAEDDFFTDNHPERRVKNRVFSEEMEKSRPARPSDTETAPSRQERQESAWNETRQTWGGESGVTGYSQMTMASQRTTRGGGGKTASQARRFWSQQLQQQRDWYMKIRDGRFSSVSAAAHVQWCLEGLRQYLCSFSAKPPEVVPAMEHTAVHAARLYELLVNRLVENMATCLAEFLHAVLTKYLANPSHMHPTDRAWLLARHILQLCCTIPQGVDILMSLKSTVLHIQTEFLRMWMSSQSTRDLRFVNYACQEMDSLISHIQGCLSNRVTLTAFSLTPTI